jgi:hypothetical protein
MPIRRDSSRLRSCASGVLDQHRRLPVGAVGHQRRVGLDLAQDAFLVEDLLDVQHLLDLAADGAFVLELQRHVVAQVHAALAAVRDGLRLGALADLGIGLQREEVVAGDGHVVHPRVQRP